ncbi:MAG: type IX secretion system outer membrane channel protein PorV [Bacteroidota bacterium]|nr:type IX secretion system outer membrane channel protein PorV [Bacteroidota bacterium]
MIKKITVLSILMFFIATFTVKGQNSNKLGQELNAITTGVPFLLIAPDARAGAMGDVGVATTPSPNSMHWNPAKYAFIEEDVSFNISYIPWLRNLVQDINFSNISGSYKISENQAFGLSLMYFTLGNITFTDMSGSTIRDFNPNEFSIDAAYALKLHKNFSGGIALRYIHSNLTGGISTQGSAPTHPGNAFAGDISMYYTKPMEINGANANLSFGINVSNLGTKITYSDTYYEFIPANFKIGTAFTYEMDDYNKVTVAFDVNRLLVPTPPRLDPLVQDSIIAGMDDNVSVPVGVFQSFYDAPGGFGEEMRENMYSLGFEYWYNNLFAVRMGYFHEDQTKGNRKYFTTGMGLMLNVFSLDFAYLFPTAGSNNPLANTLRFTLGFNFNGLKSE